MTRPFMTTVKHPSEWCNQESVVEESYKCTGAQVTIDLDSVAQVTNCGGRSWVVIKYDKGGNYPYNLRKMRICEHVIVIGD